MIPFHFPVSSFINQMVPFCQCWNVGRRNKWSRIHHNHNSNNFQFLQISVRGHTLLLYWYHRCFIVGGSWFGLVSALQAAKPNLTPDSYMPITLRTVDLISKGPVTLKGAQTTAHILEFGEHVCLYSKSSSVLDWRALISVFKWW